MGHSRTHTYLIPGLLQSSTDFKGNVVRSLTYDSVLRLTNDVDAYGHETRTEYTANDETAKLIDAEGGMVSYSYDSMGRVTNTTDALSNHTTTSYKWTSHAGYKTLQTIVEDAKGHGITTSVYEKLTLWHSDALGNTTHYRYDAEGNLTQTTDAKGHTRFLRYDGYGQLLSETDSLGFKITYTYDKNGNRISKWNWVTKTTTSYNSLNEAVKVSYNDGNVKKIRYNEYHQVSEARDKKSYYRYGYDAVGNRTKETKTTGNQTKITRFQYDARYQLIRAEYTSAGFDFTRHESSEHRPDYTESFSYDATGNRKEKRVTRNGKTTLTTYTYDNADRLLSEQTGDVHIRYEYDPAGRLIRKTYLNHQKLKSEKYTYNSQNEMTRYERQSHKGTAVTIYTYDVENLRVQKYNTAKASTYHYVYDGANLLSDSENGVIYVNNLDINAYESEITANGSVGVYLKDAIGSIRETLYNKRVPSHFIWVNNVYSET